MILNVSSVPCVNSRQETYQLVVIDEAKITCRLWKVMDDLEDHNGESILASHGPIKRQAVEIVAAHLLKWLRKLLEFLQHRVDARRVLLG